MRLNDEQSEHLRTKTVELLLDLRAEYLRSPGANALKNWEVLLTRSLRGVRRATSVDEWETIVRRTLQLGPPSRWTCSALLDLSGAVRELGAQREWLDLVQREYGLLFAMAMRANEARREAAQHDTETGEVKS